MLGIRRPPRQWLAAIISRKGDIRRDQSLDVGIRAAEHDILAGSLQVIVRDFERPRSIPATDRLTVCTSLMTIRNPRVYHGRRGTVERDASSHVAAPPSLD